MKYSLPHGEVSSEAWQEDLGLYRETGLAMSLEPIGQAAEQSPTDRRARVFVFEQ